MPTNNSINTPKPIDVSSGGTGLSTATTAYGVLAAGTTATGAFQNIGTGLTGQILTSNGAGALPTFQAAAGGGDFVLLSTVTPTSSSSIIFDNTIITSAYQTYKIVYNSLQNSGLTSQGADLVISTNNGSTYLSTGYQADCWYMGIGIGFWQNFGITATYMRLFLGGGGIVSGETYLYNVGTSRNLTMKTDVTVTDNATPSNTYWEHSAGLNSSSANVNNIKITPTGVGNTFNAGTISIYGIKT